MGKTLKDIAAAVVTGEEAKKSAKAAYEKAASKRGADTMGTLAQANKHRAFWSKHDAGGATDTAKDDLKDKAVELAFEKLNRVRQGYVDIHDKQARKTPIHKD